MTRRLKMTRDSAESMAIQALTFLADDSDRLQRFLATTGVGPQQIRSAAREPEFLAGVLNYLAADEELLVTFAAHAGVDPFDIRRAGNVLMPDNWERDVP
jgi:uncharacterized protein DUF3572